MFRHLPVAALVLVAACGKSDQETLQDAANQSDPAAAAVLNGAAENGMDPQAALEAAGQAQAGTNDAQPNSSLQARPNLPDSPNRKDGTQPPDKVDVNAQ